MNKNQIKLFDEDSFTGTAVISMCEKYRYSLHREWDTSKPMVMFLMLNPSTADSSENDATVRRCLTFAKDWGFGSLCIGNLFAFRSTKPKGLFSTEDPIGIENKWYIDYMANIAEKIVCAWGNAKTVDRIFKKFPEYKPLKDIPSDKLYYINLCNDGTPMHPLFIPKETKLNSYHL